MGSVVQDSATGNGVLDLGGTQLVNELDITILTFADLYRVSGAGNFPRYHQQGRVGLGFILSGPAYYVCFDYFILHSVDVVPVNGNIGIYANTLFWDLDPGAECKIGVYWP